MHRDAAHRVSLCMDRVSGHLWRVSDVEWQALSRYRATHLAPDTEHPTP
jgi:hypothetical protein